ncbi:hypothetical protein KAFR_0L00560 [Kazachstania africana CBS 2517]|uniref:Exocyst complex component Sec3 PIP2-binding N-terminal domain-containing protein n=1 Tax=Kazachstania africana (strain ATCC 22294 / BCRC 22015 / CBS 2517 / CECT 1963 / NBRC 1671 / NRRL Y-8276) TaxID=1071382 RepID=H2B213_KAZAF|nr:hypothetical protein KAFR_0L00560 [Kazachstania africana CBS 2517]CCF60663.1 hypothetical protein KAFR_0L00560 [Kazachstania africana CBS 2517]
MKSAISPFKKKSHSRQASMNDSTTHQRTVSSGSYKQQHGRTPSAGGIHPPVSGSNSTHRRTTSRSSTSSQNSNFLAEQYDRDRKNIIKYCFSKPNQKTHELPNNYVTHVRIIEDARYPSSRPALDSKLENKKKRVLIVSSAANDANEIYLHKARENPDGSFQIGRTWSLKDLLRIERDLQVEEGFIVTMGKKYYWETNTAKERTVFIKTLVKIYIQVFEGHVPELINWDLSTFYLDERSYKRAVVTRTSVTPTPIASPEKAMASLSLDQASVPQHENILVSEQNITRPQKFETPLKAPTEQTPQRNSLTKAPYSKNKTTLNEATNKLVLESSNTENNSTGFPTGVPELQPSASLTQVPTSHINESSISIPKSRRSEIEQSNGYMESDLDNSARRGYPATNDTLLEDLNIALSEQPDLNVPLEAAAIPSTNEQVSSKSRSNESEILPLDINAKESSKSKERLMSEEHFNSQEDELDLNETIQEQDVDLSFERGDEVRYSQSLEPNKVHMYHEVSTIQEEENAPVSGIAGVSTEAKSKKSSKKHIPIRDEDLLEALMDINWELDDDADTLLEKLESKLTETEQSFYNNMLQLQDSAPKLSAFEMDVTKECDKLNPSFSIFLMEMNNVSEDIEYVESQQNGLQVESANKKLLWNTLSELINTVSLDEGTLKELLQCPIRERNLPWMEEQLNALSNALKAIAGKSKKQNYSLKDMEALKKRREYYEKVTELFLNRVVDELGTMFAYIKNDSTSKDQLTSILSRLLVFSSLVLFCKEASNESYRSIIEQWNKNSQLIYTNIWSKILKDMNSEIPYSDEVENPQWSFQRLLKQWKNYRQTRKIIKDEPLSVNTLSSLSESFNLLELHCVTYQNFIGSFFHISSDEDFNSYVTKHRDINSRMLALDKLKPMASDRESAIAEVQLISKIFQSIVSQISTSLSDMTKNDHSVTISVMLILENKLKKLESSNQEFLQSALNRLYSQMKQTWSDFVEEQIMRAERSVFDLTNEEVSGACLELPLLVKNLEDCIFYIKEKLSIDDSDSYETISIVKVSYDTLTKTIIRVFSETRDVGTSVNIQKKSVTPEKFTELRTTLINFNWFIELLAIFNSDLNGTFDEVIISSRKIFDTEKDAYTSYLLLEAMPKLASFVNGAYHLLESGSNASSLSSWGAYSKQNLDNILNGYTSTEIDLLVEKLHERMVSYFSWSQFYQINEILCDKLWSSLQGQTVSLYLKLYTLIDKHYKNAHCRFTKNDIISAFERYKN